MPSSSAVRLETAPPLSFPCAVCGKIMKVVTVEPTTIDVLYVYECPNGHQFELVTVAPLQRGGAASTH